MLPSSRSNLRAFVGSVLLLVGAGWLFYFFGMEAFLKDAYAGETWSYFNEYAARWRAREAAPTLGAFLAKARVLLFRYAVLGTAGVTLVSALYALRPTAFTSFF